MPREAKATKHESATRILAGLAKHYAGQSIRTDGRTFTPEELVGTFQAQLDALKAVNAARAALSDAVAHERKVSKQAHGLAVRLKAFVLVVRGTSATELGAFGWTPPKKPGPKTAKAKLEGAAKMRATRAARHTMGKKQRKKIRGAPP